jgi:methionine biosynthesis protein metW
LKKELKKLKNCILCNSKLEKLFTINNMPATAQDIPSLDELDKESGISVSLCQCENCGLVQLDSEPVHYYKDVIRAGGYSSTMYRLRRSQYDEFISLCNLEGKKIFEAGCGQGEFLSILSEYPVKVYGMEHKRDLVEKALERGLTVSEGYPESEKDVFENAPFDAFTSFNFLEHQPRPKMYLKAIANNLTKDGYGLITVPSFEYILKMRGFYEIIPDHIVYYTKETLRNVLAGCGFEVIKEGIVNRDTLFAIVKKTEQKIDMIKAKKVDVSGLLEQKEIVKNEVYSLIKKAKDENKKIAVWGASHQGFTLCATTDLVGKVEYIIDSAPFKQGKYAPASHIKIISPKKALENPVDIIIIVAPGYTNEIAEIICRDFKKETKIYTLMDEHLKEF